MLRKIKEIISQYKEKKKLLKEINYYKELSKRRRII